MINVAIPWTRQRRFDDLTQTLCQEARIGNTLLGEAFKLRELRQANRSLQIGHALIVSYSYMDIALRLPMAAQETNLFSDGRIVGRHHAALASSHIFVRVKGETTRAKPS